MGSIENIEEMEEYILKCQTDAYNRISNIALEIKVLHDRADSNEAKLVDLKKELRKHELQRTSFNEEIMVKFDEITTHNKELVNAISGLTATLEVAKSDLEENKEYVDAKKLEEAVTARVNEINEPKASFWRKVKLAVYTSLIVSAITLTSGALWFGIKLYVAIYGVDG